jgi:hypothetical protein
MKSSERRKRAKSSGATQDDLDEVDDAEDVQEALISLIVSLEFPAPVPAPVPDSDDSDDELNEDTNNYCEISHEGVDYLEDEESGNIYSTEFKLLGKWDETNDDIMWVSKEVSDDHDARKD